MSSLILSLLLLQVVSNLYNFYLISQLLQARHQCVDLGGILAVLNTPTTWGEVTGILFKKRSFPVYIGLSSGSPNLPKMYVVPMRSGLLLIYCSRFASFSPSLCYCFISDI